MVSRWVGVVSFLVVGVVGCRTTADPAAGAEDRLTLPVQDDCPLDKEDVPLECSANDEWFDHEIFTLPREIAQPACAFLNRVAIGSGSKIRMRLNGIGATDCASEIGCDSFSSHEWSGSGFVEVCGLRAQGSFTDKQENLYSGCLECDEGEEEPTGFCSPDRGCRTEVRETDGAAGFGITVERQLGVSGPLPGGTLGVSVMGAVSVLGNGSLHRKVHTASGTACDDGACPAPPDDEFSVGIEPQFLVRGVGTLATVQVALIGSGSLGVVGRRNGQCLEFDTTATVRGRVELRAAGFGLSVGDPIWEWECTLTSRYDTCGSWQDPTVACNTVTPPPATCQFHGCPDGQECYPDGECKTPAPAPNLCGLCVSECEADCYDYGGGPGCEEACIDCECSDDCTDVAFDCTAWDEIIGWTDGTPDE